MPWTLARAKDQLSEVIRQAVGQGPQPITIRGRETAVVLSKADFDRLCDPGAPRTLKALLGQMNLDDLDLTRDPLPPRDIDL